MNLRSIRLAAPAAICILLAGCAGTPDQPGQAAAGNRYAPPAGHCVRHRPGIDVSGEHPRTVRVCELWWFGPSREQDMRFRQNRQPAAKD